MQKLFFEDNINNVLKMHVFLFESTCAFFAQIESKSNSYSGILIIRDCQFKKVLHYNFICQCSKMEHVLFSSSFRCGITFN